MSDSLLDIRRALLPQESDHDLVVGIAREAVRELCLRPPVDLRIVASYFGIARVEVVPLPWAGCLIATNDGVEIKVNEADGPARRRFTGFHEVTHTFMPGFRMVPQLRCSPERGGQRPAVEVLCDAGASEFLLPHAYFGRDVTQGAFGLDLVEELAASYEASLEACANRLVDCWPEPSAFYSLEVRNKPRDAPRAIPRLRVNSSHAHSDFPYAPRHKSIVLGSVAAVASGQVFEVDERLHNAEFLNHRIGSVHVSARPYPYINQEGIMKNRILMLVRRTQSTF